MPIKLIPWLSFAGLMLSVVGMCAITFVLIDTKGEPPGLLLQIVAGLMAAISLGYAACIDTVWRSHEEPRSGALRWSARGSYGATGCTFGFFLMTLSIHPLFFWGALLLPLSLLFYFYSFLLLIAAPGVLPHLHQPYHACPGKDC